MYRVFYSSTARQDLKNLEPRIAQRIINKVHFFVSQDDPIKYAKNLLDHSLGQFRFRIGDYRVIFDIIKEHNDNILYILKIRHRKDAYRA